MSIFDDEVPVSAPKVASKSDKTFKLKKPAAVSTKGGSAPSLTEDLPELEVTQPPEINGKITKLIQNMVNKHKLIKRSLLVSNTIAALMPSDQDQDMSDDEYNAYHGVVTSVLSTMVQEFDIQEFRFVNQESKYIDSMLVSASLELESPGLPDDEDEEGFPDLSAELSDDDDSEGEDERTLTLDDELAGDIGNIVSTEGTSSESFNSMLERQLNGGTQEELLHSRVELFAVTDMTDSEHTTLVFEDAGAAQAELQFKSRDNSKSFQVFGMIPIEVQVRLKFKPVSTGESPSSFISERPLDMSAITQQAVRDIAETEGDSASAFDFSTDEDSPNAVPNPS